MNTVKLAQHLAQEAGMKAYKYDLVLREFDNMVELIGLVNDPTLDIGDFDSREMLFPKKWVTLKTFFAEERIAV